MSDDELVTLEVPESHVRHMALNYDGVMGDLSRKWVAAHDRPERRERRGRREFIQSVVRNGYVFTNDTCPVAVPVEDLRPGDRVAGREVKEDPRTLQLGGGIVVRIFWTDGTYSDSAPGHPVILDPEGDRG